MEEINAERGGGYDFRTFFTNNFLMINQIFCLTPVQQRGMGDMISEPFVINNFLMINQIYPNILFDICSAERDG